jgi:hypothetical protein
MARKRRKVEPKYTVDILAMRVWNITRAGSAIQLRVRGRKCVLGTVEIGQGTFGWRKLAEDIQKYY